MGPIRHPALYRCAVSWIGVTDLTLLFDNSYWSDASAESIRYTLPQLLGDPATEAERLKATSPAHLAAQLKVPVLLAWGGEDRRVQPAHGERMRDALTAAGRPPTWVVYPDEAHGWLKPENRLDWAQRLERFLAEHLQ
jgi:dipeptidyl aminopeptidase/acylaminoacyl peptidase